MIRFRCAACNRKSYVQPKHYHGREYGPDCYRQLMLRVSELANKKGAVYHGCSACGNTFLALPSFLVCVACTLRPIGGVSDGSRSSGSV